MGKKGSIYLVSQFLGESGSADNLPAADILKIHSLNHFIAEKAKSARSFFKKIQHPTPLPSIHIEEYNNKSQPEDLYHVVKPILAGNDVGIISEAGNPCIADPGSDIVKWAHQNGVRVIPLTGPSSILLALIAGGIGGQQFTFNGYIPIDDSEKKKTVKNMLEQAKRGYTQLFMETPYRNLKTLEFILQQLPGDMQFSIAADITQDNEYIVTKTVAQWRGKLPKIHKVPAIFGFGL